MNAPQHHQQLQPNQLSQQPDLPRSQDDEINLLELFDVVLDSRLLIAAVTTLALVVGAAYAFLVTPVYEANTLIKLRKANPAAVPRPAHWARPPACFKFSPRRRPR